MSRALVIIGLVLILLAVILRVTSIPLMISARAIKPSSFLILANTAFLLALITKK